MSESQIFADFSRERYRAHELHGKQSQEGNAWDSRRSTEILVVEIGEIAKVFNERALGNLTDLEAMRELRNELVQVGSMCLVWIDNIDNDMPSDAAWRQR